ncbi:TPA: bifunctional (p)ppGpp synthetase/guanosine-3',5'-bis(diphosphate) 3'-pyrophosphohydrolase [Burkholderia multivorans]|uniref:RelA/SpoT family protein n=1 Tax=Burkholderia multivorans TaxID=87883 RepID=UPI000CFFC713|nr:bifunctional (p)ppGpp synthetase/guanosine-3',5'-bis(diphosphate) 3'-pyrophosphohydrolase [Burkholderia multivorans]MBU9127574.1 bifunctional (p)ppGpp synthetase/guanosine-3',5'-bis(diphosphate) 3'-pyrophosphohydrolase [Burkholderia multivorans]MBU9296950.1 bifunctional (p)ppGpp synthetase/guanosine-3',5'-bis(diphosphate) 3'-pyrophosphohydrolase [Burkholderia multivorans]MBU9302525.1 bifunctional (p)ppGpp synthetase/guanosine-3',5'-bis(diphosphate) 3'-pyrophosphohydrolase [Burkholderia multiv
MTESVSASSVAAPSFDDVLAFVRERAGDACLASGERLADHAAGTAAIMRTLNVDPPAMQAAALFALTPHLSDPERELTERFGDEVARLVADVRKLLRLGTVSLRAAQHTAPEAGRDAAQQRRAQIEALRKMLLAFAQDIRVVLIRLASRLQSLRYYAAAKLEPPPEVARETLEIYAPLANRLGIWQLKWELEDLAFRFEDPITYKRIAKLLDEKRAEREAYVAQAIERLQQELAAANVQADVSGRPKHIYSIWRKMRGKELDFSELYDVRAFRVIVPDIKDCYAVLGIVHHLWQPVPKEFDDYISRPKPNGYKSLHTVVIGDDGRAFEVQIRTQEMHRFAEYGVAAHWRYKEAGTRGYGGQFSASDKYDEKIAWLRQLLAWKDDVEDGAEQSGDKAWAQLRETSLDDDHIYVLTPQARVIALPQGATPVDFAYHLHSELGHRCRGARVDGAMVPLNTPLANGQTVEIVAVKEGGPSRDWLNPQLGYLKSPRARQKVRAWFNAIEQEENIAHGRALVEKTLQREGKTSVSLDSLAAKLGFKSPEELFSVVGKEEFSLRNIEQALSDAPPAEPAPEAPADFEKRSSGASVAHGASTGVLVVGVDALLTQLARCCRPAPPDPISGFVTRGKGMSIHRSDCATFRRMAERAPERVLHTTWSADVLGGRGASVYPVDLMIEATDRQGLLRDISEVFAREKMNVVGVKTQSRRNTAFMQFTVEVSNSAQVQRACTLLGEVQGVVRARRKA